MRMRHLTIAFIVLFLLSAIALLPVTEAVDVTGRQSLLGLKGVYLLIENTNPSAIRDGLTTNQIKNDVEAKLQKAGIKRLAKKDTIQMPGSPCLIVKIYAFKQGLDTCLFLVLVELLQDVVLERDASIEVVDAITWRAGEMGIVRWDDLRKVRDSLGDMVDMFIEDYLAMNPKS